MRDFFEFGKHRLADDRAADVVDFAIDEISSFALVSTVAEQVVADEFFVKRARHFRHEDRVAVVLVRLVGFGIERVHRVARFVGQGEEVVEDFGLVVHEDVGVAVVGTAAERAALFALVRIAVAPAAGETFFQRGAVFGAERGEGGDDDIHRLLPGVAFFDIAENGEIRVVVVDVRKLHLAAADVVVAMDGGQVFANGGDQVVVDRLRDVVRIESRFEGRFVVADLSVVDVFLDRALIRGGERVFVAGELFVVFAGGAVLCTSRS